MSFTDLTIEEYTNRSIVVQGDTRKYKEDLKKLGGKYNGYLKNGPGWIFPKTSEGDLKTFINRGKRLVTAEEAKEGEERSKKRAEEWSKQKETPTHNKVVYSRECSSSSSSNSISNTTPTITEYASIINLVKNTAIKMERLEHAVLLLLSDEQKEMLNVLMKPKEKKTVVKKVVKSSEKNADSDTESGTCSSSDEDEHIPRRRLLR